MEKWQHWMEGAKVPKGRAHFKNPFPLCGHYSVLGNPTNTHANISSRFQIFYSHFTFVTVLTPTSLDFVTFLPVATFSFILQ